MDNYHPASRPVNRGVTLNRLKEQLHSLNMRLLLAIQNHDTEEQERITAQMASVQAEMEQLCLGSRR